MGRVDGKTDKTDFINLALHLKPESAQVHYIRIYIIHIMRVWDYCNFRRFFYRIFSLQIKRYKSKSKRQKEKETQRATAGGFAALAP